MYPVVELKNQPCFTLCVSGWLVKKEVGWNDNMGWNSFEQFVYWSDNASLLFVNSHIDDVMLAVRRCADSDVSDLQTSKSIKYIYYR